MKASDIGVVHSSGQHSSAVASRPSAARTHDAVPAAAAASHHAGDTDADLHIAEGAPVVLTTFSSQWTPEMKASVEMLVPS